MFITAVCVFFWIIHDHHTASPIEKVFLLSGKEDHRLAIRLNSKLTLILGQFNHVLNNRAQTWSLLELTTTQCYLFLNILLWQKIKELIRIFEMLSLGRTPKNLVMLRRLDSSKEGNNKLMGLRKGLKHLTTKTGGMRKDCDICAVQLVSKHSLSY